MKKFFGKLPVMITFVALAVVFAVVYVGMLVRPVAIGMTYKGEMTVVGHKAEATIKVKSGSKVDVKFVADGEKEEYKNVRYVENDGKIYVLMEFVGEEMTDEAYKAKKEEILKNWATYETAGALWEVNAFGIEATSDIASLDLGCPGSVVFAIVGGVLELVLLAGAGLAVFYTVKKK